MTAPLMSEEPLEKKYGLRPNHHKYIADIYDVQRGYGDLHQLAKEKFSGDIDAEFPLVDHQRMIRNVLSKEDIGQFRSLFETKPRGHTLSKDIIPLVEKVLTPQVDAAIKNYFQSDYAILWHGWSELQANDDPNIYFTKWHCDSGPSAHLKTITYFDDTCEHQSKTAFCSVGATDKLKKLGYIFNDLALRGRDISDIAASYDIDLGIDEISFEAGDTVIFNPAQRAHCGVMPKRGHVRHNLSLCIVPSPIGWRKMLEEGVYPHDGNIDFSTGAVETLLKLSGEKREDTLVEVIESNQQGHITTIESLRYHLNTIFSNKSLANTLFKQITNSGQSFTPVSVSQLVIELKKIYQRDLNWDHHFSTDALVNFGDILEFEKNFTLSQNAYSPAGKPKPNAVFWPVPNHEKHPQNKFSMLPFVKQHKIMTKRTPVGSAGSCFAFEIAEYMQDNDYNYVISELADNPAEETIVDGYQAGTGKAKFSANYGILFNTPSLKQLAEKAFGLREFTRHFVQIENDLYMDPYRENVFFLNKGNYLRDYPKHIAAIKKSLLDSEVFIFTAGLNECWQMHDGTVISRNPRAGFHHLIKHRVLTVQENIDNIVSFFNIVKKHNPNFKLVLSLSPVPLLATGRGYDHHILEANTHSKAVLRVALEEVVKQHEDIYYLPSYELVTECAEKPWLPDHRHVTRDTVARVMEMFNEIFVSDSL